jgi:hypothetical protein
MHWRNEKQKPNGEPDTNFQFVLLLIFIFALLMTVIAFGW